MFHDYLAASAVKDARRALIDLFVALDTRAEERDPYMDEALAAFPYVNGGLFADEHIEIPRLDEGIVSLLLNKACKFDWSQISPTIFGAVFESTLNPETRRSGGMHYTSIENIHKVIDPLFLDDLRAELEEIKMDAVIKSRAARLVAFQEKLSSLTFLDPACGSGNFLTETYLSLRRLENEALSLLHGGQIVFGELEGANPIKVSIGQFYGIEINDFAVTVAKTALWIAESQMLAETEHVVQKSLDFLPLKTYANIAEGNALRMDWEGVIPKAKLNYIMGNPPFVGYSNQSTAQKEDLLSVFGQTWKNAGKLDYVSCWYKKAADMMAGTTIRSGFVSTNSITQGEQVALLWKPLFEEGVRIDFAHRTFKWNSESTEKAAVHCVIVGFSVSPNEKPKAIYSNDRATAASNINGYLLDAPNIFIDRRSKPLCDVPEIRAGGKPTDGGFLVLTEEEKNELLKKEPQAAPLIRPFMMGEDFIKRNARYCLWLVGVSPSLLQKCPMVMRRIEKVREFRLASKKAATRKKAETPMLFDEIRPCETDFVAIPELSSDNRRYIPIDYLPSEVIAGNGLFAMQNATLYHFGVLASNVHNAWNRAVCGRFGTGYRYSNILVYNNFPWPNPTEEQKAKIEQTAQGILDARARFPEASLAVLYKESIMPPELRKAHQANDKAVMQAYGFDLKMTEAECVGELMNQWLARSGAGRVDQ